MKFSIITPCFNSENTIERTLKSVLNQTYSMYEYIIVDGGSTDSTLDIIRSYKDFFGDKLKVISEPDNGIYDAMNKGISWATGDFVGIVNSDDFYEEDCLTIVSSYIQKENGKYQILYGGMRCLDKAGVVVSELFYHHNYLSEMMINHPATFVSKAVYDDFGMYDVRYRSAADYDLFLRLQKCKMIRFVPITKVLTNFTYGGMSSSLQGTYETIVVKYKNGIISKKEYIIRECKIFLKKVLKHLRD